jgi:CRISPR-associated protein Csm4
MDTQVVKLTFAAPVHFGNGRLSDSSCTCDAATLFSALYIEALGMGGSEADRLLKAAQSGELVLSDAFPFINDTFYLPKPMLDPALAQHNRTDTPNGDSRERKAHKKLSHIPAGSYAAYLAGSFDAVAELQNFAKLGKPSLQTKVNLMRQTSDDAEPYQVGGYSFRPGCGLYFLLRCPFDATPLLDRLGYSGLGGKRSSGYGRLTYEYAATNPLLQAKRATGGSGQAHVLLSTAAPAEHELTDGLLEGARYRLVRKGGFVQSATHSANPQKKRDLFLFAAGSTFSRPFDGTVFDVNATPGAHPVYRYARALWMEV